MILCIKIWRDVVEKVFLEIFLERKEMLIILRYIDREYYGGSLLKFELREE